MQIGAPSSFLRVDEFNESAEPESELDPLSVGNPDNERWTTPSGEPTNGGEPPTNDTADTGQPAESRSSGRPSLRRDSWAPMPEHPPPPVPSEPNPEDYDSSTDSLSLAQLRRIVSEMPKKEATPYAFEYQDTSSFEEEVEELFDYSSEDRACLSHSFSSFEELWHQWSPTSPSRLESSPIERRAWISADETLKDDFLHKLRAELVQPSDMSADQIMSALSYLALGCWKETAKRTDSDAIHPDTSQAVDKIRPNARSQRQVSEMKANLGRIANRVGVDIIFQTTKSACSNLFVDDAKVNGAAPDLASAFFLPRSCLVLMYLLLDYARRSHATYADEVVSTILHYFTGLLADLRWNESSVLPLSKILPLYSKTVLLMFGGTKDIQNIRDTLNEDIKPQDGDTAALITASPLDYHLFRQEITSKYPAFDPPQPLFPFEADTTSMMPPLQSHRKSGVHGESGGPASVNGNGSSIFHQPVHIATPAPSPPPSPAGPGGKGIKKQNYQTNQLFPFLYPPLDDTSNSIGGKGNTELQDLLVGRKWEGSDIPTSILEAADIFATRMRAPRTMKQLWDERVRFIKYERGYLASTTDMTYGDDDKDVHDDGKKANEPHRTIPDSTLGKLDDDSRNRLAAVEEFYVSQLPQLQSLVIFLLKTLLQTVTTLVTRPNAPNGLQTGFESPDHNAQDRPQVNGTASNEHTEEDVTGLENVNTLRTQEITGKAISSILLLLLKWFKVSHILKFEYLSQLLVDSNAVQLILQLFSHQELERAVNVKNEKPNLNFFMWCRRNANSTSSSPYPNSATEPPNQSTDEAVPPPIPRTNTAIPIEPQLQASDPSDPPVTSVPPEVDELGFTTSSPSQAPITNYSWRTFFTAINHLRIMQKLLKRKSHRQMSLMQFRNATILKKSLKVPQPDVRLYTLKVIKGLVPFQQRKWRQSNMRIITAIYLHCKPELRDDWLAGLTLDEDAAEALQQEQALRSLTYWHNLTRYPEAVTDDPKKARGLLEEEQDFFVRELEAIQAASRDSVELEGDVPELEAVPRGWSERDRDLLMARMREVQEVGEGHERYGLWDA